MADKKPYDFQSISTVTDSTELYTQPSGTADRKFLLSTLWTYIRGKISGGNQTVSNGDSISVNADELVIAISFLSTTTQTIQVGTSSGGSQVIEDVELTASQTATEVIHYQFVSAGALYFTCTGSITVRVKKI